MRRYAELGIQEYFIFDRRRLTLRGHFLEEPNARSYQSMVPQAGRWPSAVLGLDFGLEGERLRLFAGTAVIPETSEVLGRAEHLLVEVQLYLEAVEQRSTELEQRSTELE